MCNRTLKLYNLNIVDPLSTEGIYDIPKVRTTESIPNTFITFNEALSYRGDVSNLGVHFYIDDYQFERLWSNPERYVSLLSRFKSVITPDFSLCFDMPQAMQIWNVYRQRALGNYWNQCGIRTIPSVNFSDERSYPYCFSGIQPNSIISIGNRGVARISIYKKRWIKGIEEAVRRLTPKKILVYGSQIPFNSAGADVVWIPARKFRRGVKNVGKRTEYLLSNPELVRIVAISIGIEEQDFEDFYQETIYKSMTTKDEFDPSKSSIKTWTSKFVKVCGRIFLRENSRQELLFPSEILDSLE